MSQFEVCESMAVSSLHGEKDRISQLPDDILLQCLSLLDIKNAAQTSTMSQRWRYLWTHLTNLDFDHKEMYSEEFATSRDREKYETPKYFACVNQVINVHRCPSINKFRVHFRYLSSYATQLGGWVKFALSKRVKELVLDLIGKNLSCADSAEYSIKGYPLGFDILRHPPCYSGITALQSLHLRYVNVSTEVLEFVLSRCLHLERLYLDTIQLSKVKVKASKLKYLTIKMWLWGLEELEIDAQNLVYFEYNDLFTQGGPRMVFKNLPMLVETNFGGGLCRYPFPIFRKLSLFSTQLRKLSIDLETELIAHNAGLVIHDGFIPVFPSVKHFTCRATCFPNCCILPMKRFIEACPTLEEFKLEVRYFCPDKNEEASELREIDLEDDKKIVETEIDFNKDHNNLELVGQVLDVEVEEINEKKESHSNLRILELAGFLGVCTDVQLALAVVSYACSLKTIICDCNTRGMFGTRGRTDDYYDVAKRRARKLAQIVAPKVRVVTI